ncbi:MAG: hypothetical protein HY362_01100 [Candidatus Aenigmarchaeota archaeon]|nr:hypothetical protein [Candidatus Aenigmarchaeota archaeon]
MAETTIPSKPRIGETLKKGVKYIGRGVKEYFFWPGTAHDYLEQERGWKCMTASASTKLGAVGHSVGEAFVYSELLYNYVPENLRRAAELGLVCIALLRYTPTMIARAEHKQEQRGMQMGMGKLNLEGGGI